jgi:Flp pilus assembly pilin Flp
MPESGGANAPSPHEQEQTDMIRRFVRDNGGQDLIEYSLLLGFIALSGAASIITIGGSIDTLWTVINGRVSDAGS